MICAGACGGAAWRRKHEGGDRRRVPDPAGRGRAAVNRASRHLKRSLPVSFGACRGRQNPQNDQLFVVAVTISFSVGLGSRSAPSRPRTIQPSLMARLPSTQSAMVDGRFRFLNPLDAEQDDRAGLPQTRAAPPRGLQ